MTLSFKKVALLASGLVLGMTLGIPKEAEAAIIAYRFDINITSGPLTGNTYSGRLRFDDATISGSNPATAPLTFFDFSFEGTDYDLTDDPLAVAAFDNSNEFLGIDYSIQAPPSPNFTSGAFDVSEAVFSYDTGTESGFGDIEYAIVPEPSTIIGSIGLVGLIAKNRKRYQKK